MRSMTYRDGAVRDVKSASVGAALLGARWFHSFGRMHHVIFDPAAQARVWCFVQLTLRTCPPMAIASTILADIA